MTNTVVIHVNTYCYIHEYVQVNRKDRKNFSLLYYVFAKKFQNFRFISKSDGENLFKTKKERKKEINFGEVKLNIVQSLFRRHKPCYILYTNTITFNSKNWVPESPLVYQEKMATPKQWNSFNMHKDVQISQNRNW